jgi:uncharacterized protein (DUF2461 family)
LAMADVDSNYPSALAALRTALQKRSTDAEFTKMRQAKRIVLERFQAAFRNPGTIEASTVRDFLTFKNNHHWSGLHRHGGKLTKDLPALRKALVLLVDETKPLAARIDGARDLVDGLGPAIATAMLLVADPDKYGVLNNTSEAGAKRLGLLPDGWTTISVGEKCASFNETLKKLAKDLDVDLWSLDALWWVAGSTDATDAALMPTYDALMNPLLQALRESPQRSASIRELNDRVYVVAKIPDALLDVMHGETTTREVDYRLAWTRTYLKAFGAIENPSRGVWRLRADFQQDSVDPTAVVRQVQAKNGAEALDVDVVIADWLASADEDQLIRDEAEAQARGILEANLGRLTGPHLRDFMRHINTCQSANGKAVFSRFSPAFVGHNANKLVAALPRLNPLIERLWNAPDNEVPAVVDKFFADAPPGAGRSFPTAILYLRDPERYAVWTDWLDRALHRTLGVAEHERSGAGYLAYCADVHGFMREHDVPASLHDKAVWVLDQAHSSSGHEDGEATAFIGFTDDTFSFMADLRANNRDDWFEQNRSRFRDAVDKPLRSLVEDIGGRVIHALAPNLEISAKSGKTISKIRKNIWGKKSEDTYNPWYWAAFYRRDRTKQTDAQLFMSLRSSGFTHGLYLQESAPDVMKRLADACVLRPAVINTIISALVADGFAFSVGGGEDGPGATEKVENADDLARLLKGPSIEVFKHTAAGDAVGEGSRLAERVGTDLRQIFPLFSLATDDAPPDSILDFLKDDPSDEVEPVVAAPPITLASLCERTFLDAGFFTRIEKLLADKRQIILHGPPGTGKTLVALEYAAYLAQRGGEVVTVQFHPSYGYEDFVEGLRPVVENGQLQYRVERGIFRILCDKARANPKAKFVLIVDEINRGNLPRIFGELLFLLERRDQSVVLPYSKQTFSVPENVVLVGTMNSADRSIALLDLALRRRFHFVAMTPNEAVLRSWLAAHERPLWIADLLAVLNGDLEAAGIDAERLVGHSHFMMKGVDDEAIRLVWEATIEPLLAELFFAEPERLDGFSLERLRARAAGAASPPA